MKKSKRKDIRFKNWVYVIGAIMTLLGLGGLGGMAEGEGSAIVAILTFSIGMGCVFWSYER